MAVNRFSPGCECCDTGCIRLSDNAQGSTVSSLWDNTDGAFASGDYGYYNTTTSGTLMSNRPMATTDKKGSLRFYFSRLEVGATLKILFDYEDSNNHHYLTVSRTADTDCTWVDPDGTGSTGLPRHSLESNYDFVIGKMDSGVDSSIASRTGVRGLEPDDERLCVEWDATHVIVHTTILVDPIWVDEAGYWNCEPSGFGLTTEYTTFDGANYGFSHDESSENQIRFKIIRATKSRVEENCPGCYLDCPCNVVPEEFDITVTGIDNGEWKYIFCSNCSNLNDTYTLTLQADNYEKFPFGYQEWLDRRRPRVGEGSWGRNTIRSIRGMPYASGNCVYAYSSAGHSSPPQGSCDPGGDVYIEKMFLWFTDGLAHLQICLYSDRPMWTYDSPWYIQPPLNPAYPLCSKGAGAVFTFELDEVSGTQYHDCFINESDVCPDTMHWWGEGRPQIDIECGSYNSGLTCGLSKMKISVVGS
jgi:hypothetical protein